MKPLARQLTRLAIGAGALLALGGCVYGPYERPGVVYDDEVAPAYYGGSYGYYGGPYYSPSYYGYYGPAYYDPWYSWPYNVGLGFYYSGGHNWHGGHHHGGYRHGGGHHSGGHHSGGHHGHHH